MRAVTLGTVADAESGLLIVIARGLDRLDPTAALDTAAFIAHHVDPLQRDILNTPPRPRPAAGAM